jgi:chemotaxis protein CheD
MLVLDADLPEVYLQPGESRLVTKPTRMKTLLGSCVGIVFWAPRLGVGALCHPMMPRCPSKSQDKMSPAASRRYVDFAIRDLAQEFDARGVCRSEVYVKLFGGADVLLTQESDRLRPTVGRLNCEMAMKVLSDEGFNVVAFKLRGTSGCKIQFDTGTGEVLLRWIK